MTVRSPLARAWTSALVALLCLGAAPSQAQTAAWPKGKTITLIVGYPAGGSVDLVARTIAEPLAKRLGTAVIVENQGGAGGVIGAQKVVNAAPDGYTLLLGSGSEVSLARLYNQMVKYNGQTDLSHIGLIGTTAMVFVAGPSAGVKTLDEALRRAKREPDSLSFASSGVGTPLHIAGELINLKAGIKLRHVPYRGAGQMLQDVLGGNIEFGVFVLSSALAHIESGKIVPLGVTTLTRSRSAPQIAPLADDARLKGYDMNVWFGLFGPATLPQPIAARLNQELNELLREPQVWQTLNKSGISTEGGTQSALSEFIRAETQRVREVVNLTLLSTPNAAK